MNKPPVFLSAQWRKLIMVNYKVDPEILKPWLPKHTELDFYNGLCLISLVGFMFIDTKLKGLSIPFHRNFEEFNLRFYVRHKENGVWKRGTVFISEIVPKFVIPAIANTLYREHYVRYPMKHSIISTTNELNVSYSFKINNNWNSIAVTAGTALTHLQTDGLEEFIAQHYWGYNKWDEVRTLEYEVEHPAWQTYPIKSTTVNCKFEDIYPAVFHPFLYAQPHSSLLAEGSAISVRKGRMI